MTLNIPQADRMGVGGYVRYARTKIASCVRSVFFSGKKVGCPCGFGFLIFIQEGRHLFVLLVWFSPLEQNFLVPQNFSVPEFQEKSTVSQHVSIPSVQLF